MNENRDLLRVYVAVDPGKILRCEWCGVAESESWQRTQHGNFCSLGCYDAAQVGSNIFVYLFLVVLISSIPVLLASIQPDALIALPFIVLVFSPFLYCAKAGWDFRKRVPRGSRRDEISSDMALLKTISSGVACPRCNANIDVRKVGEDRAYRCEYYGASGTIELVRSQ